AQGGQAGRGRDGGLRRRFRRRQGEQARVIVAADIGGTKTSVALLESPRDNSAASQTSVLLQRARYQSAQYAGLTEIIAEFLAAHDIAPRSVQRVCAGVAGPVVEGHVETPNLPWCV